MFANLSIRVKLALIIIFVSGLSVLLTVVGITSFTIYTTRQNMVQGLSNDASFLGNTLGTAISYGDGDFAKTRIESALSGRKNILKGCVYDKDNHEFVSYKRDGKISGCPSALAGEVTKFSGDSLKISRLIFSKGTPVGSIFIESDLEEISVFVQKQVITATSVIFLVFFLSYLLAMKLQKSISVPILHLVGVARIVSQNNDYSVRAQVQESGEGAKNEVNVLVSAFNNMLSDIEERDKILQNKNEELLRAKEIADAANRAKSQFLANISHELRTPLNAVIGFSDILQKEMLGPMSNDKYLEYARDINESGVHLLEIINDILDLSKAEAGKLDVNMADIRVEKCIRECITIISRRAKDSGILINTDLPPRMPMLVADRIRFKQIILNILSNAVKFTGPGGEITISVRVAYNENKEPSEFRVRISDTGIGMAQEDIAKAFKSFVQIDSGLDRKYEGTGLGLPLTKKLVELHHGEIFIESTLGKGTTVNLVFPSNYEHRYSSSVA